MPDQSATNGLRGRLRRARADLLGLRLFDAVQYRDTTDLSGGKRPLYRHFLAVGWRGGLDPNGWFSCAAYLDANPDVAQSGQNPWLHFIRSGRHEQRPLATDVRAPMEPVSTAGPLTLEDTLLQATRGLVDAQFYLAAYPDVEATGLAAPEHFAAYGWKEGRTPAPWFNVEYLRTHAPLYRLGTVNPLTDLLRLTTGAPPSVPAPTTWWVNPEAAIKALRGLQKTAHVLVVIHAYYPEDLDVFSKYIARLGPSVQVVVTCPANTAAVCERWAVRNGLEVVIAETVNRGRDWGPFLAVAREIGGYRWDAILKLHTKRSPHRTDGAQWLAFVLDGLVPDRNIESSACRILTSSEFDILASPGTLSSRQGWVPEAPSTKAFYTAHAQVGGNASFPAGSMFWMSGRLFTALSRLPLSVGDFEPELGQLDGTLAHALERVVVDLEQTPVGLVPSDSSSDRHAGDGVDQLIYRSKMRPGGVELKSNGGAGS